MTRIESQLAAAIRFGSDVEDLTNFERDRNVAVLGKHRDRIFVHLNCHAAWLSNSSPANDAASAAAAHNHTDRRRLQAVLD